MVSTPTGKHTKLTMDIFKTHITGIDNSHVFLNAYPSVFRKCHNLLLYSTPTRLSVCFCESVVLLSLLPIRAEKSSNIKTFRATFSMKQYTNSLHDILLLNRNYLSTLTPSRGLIYSCPPINGRNASGIRTLPSGCW